MPLDIPPALAQLHILDLRPDLPVQQSPDCRRPRRGLISGATLHYNGPPVSVAGNPKRELQHIVQVDVPNHWSRLGADSLQYHFVVLSNGAIYLTRDLVYQAWHCGNKVGNEQHLAVHLPLGGAQDATPIQWDRACALFDAISMVYHLPGRSAIKGHCEWKPTLCPGPRLYPRLQAWRRDVPHASTFYRVRRDVASANVREGPSRAFPVALGGKAVLYPGDTLDADVVVEGESIGGDLRWAHRRDGVGFVHLSLLEAT